MKICISGPSGSGKTTIANAISDTYNLPKVITCTTRKPRKDEEDGVDYRFLSDVDFSEMSENDKFLETTVYAGNRYGSLISDIPEDFVVAMTIDGMIRLSELYPDTLCIWLDYNIASKAHASPVEDSWERSLRAKLDNEISSDLPQLIYTVKATQTVENVLADIAGIIKYGCRDLSSVPHVGIRFPYAKVNAYRCYDFSKNDIVRFLNDVTSGDSVLDLTIYDSERVENLTGIQTAQATLLYAACCLSQDKLDPEAVIAKVSDIFTEA